MIQSMAPASLWKQVYGAHENNPDRISPALPFLGTGDEAHHPEPLVATSGPNGRSASLLLAGVAPSSTCYPHVKSGMWADPPSPFEGCDRRVLGLFIFVLIFGGVLSCK